MDDSKSGGVVVGRGLDNFAQNKYSFRSSNPAAAAAPNHANGNAFGKLLDGLPHHDLKESPPSAQAATAAPAVPADPAVVTVDAEKVAEEQSRAMIKQAAPGLLNNVMMLNVAKMALFGMLGGAVYGMARGTADMQGVLYELKHPTKAFDMDPFASLLFHKLGKHEYLQPHSYKMAISCADNLFQLERQLADRTTRPRDADTSFAQTYIDGVMGNIWIIRNHAQNGTQRGEINILKEEISEMLFDHLKRILSLCATLRL